MTDDTLILDSGPIQPIASEQAKDAARMVAANTHDAADAHLILTMLGLLERGRIVAPVVLKVETVRAMCEQRIEQTRCAWCAGCP